MEVKSIVKICGFIGAIVIQYVECEEALARESMPFNIINRNSKECDLT